MHKVFEKVLVALLVVELLRDEVGIALSGLDTFDNLGCEAEHGPSVGPLSFDFHGFLVDALVETLEVAGEFIVDLVVE